jgi:hypothetical protein
MKPGGTEGGSGKWLIGLILFGLGIYFLFDSIRVSSGGAGMLTGMMGGGRRGGGWQNTTSMGLIFVPFILSMIALFVNAKWKIAWIGLWCSLGVIVIEMLSRIRFMMHMKSSHMMMMLAMIAAGIGLMLGGYLENRSKED